MERERGKGSHYSVGKILSHENSCETFFLLRRIGCKSADHNSLGCLFRLELDLHRLGVPGHVDADISGLEHARSSPCSFFISVSSPWTRIMYWGWTTPMNSLVCLKSECAEKRYSGRGISLGPLCHSKSSPLMVSRHYSLSKRGGRGKRDMKKRVCGGGYFLLLKNLCKTLFDTVPRDDDPISGVRAPPVEKFARLSIL